MRFNFTVNLYYKLLSINKNQWNIKWFIAMCSVGETTNYSMFLPLSISFINQEQSSKIKFINKTGSNLLESAVNHNAV